MTSSTQSQSRYLRGIAEQDPSRTRVSDLTARQGVVLDSPDDTLSSESTLIRGRFFNQELRKGLFIHGSNAVEEHAFSVDASIKGGISCVFFLAGSVDVTVGDRLFNMRGNPEGKPQARALISNVPESFHRQTRHPQHVCHLAVTATPEWLDQEGLAGLQDSKLDTRLFREKLANHHWTPSDAASGRLLELFQPSTLLPELRRMYLESRAIELIADSIAHILQRELPEAAGRRFNSHDRLRLQRAREVIAAAGGTALSIDFIAREAGVSASGLQRLFRRAEGCSVFEYIRSSRLERALHALQAEHVTVQQASEIAGYSNPANFATAFRRRFGLTPRQASGRSLKHSDE